MNLIATGSLERIFEDINLVADFFNHALARVDAGDMDGTLSSCIKTYLEVPNLDIIPEKLPDFNEWQISLLKGSIVF